MERPTDRLYLRKDAAGMKRPALSTFILACVGTTILFGLAGTIGPAFGYLPALGGHHPNLESFRALMAEPHLPRSVFISLATGLVTTAVSLALVVLFVAGYAGTRLFQRIQHLVSPLLSVPHAAAAFGFAFLVAPSGLLMRVVSPALTGFASPPDWLIPQDALGLTMMAGLVAKEMPFLFLVTLAALPQVPLAQTQQLVASLGYGRIRGFLIGIWPLIYRQIRLPIFAVIAYVTSVVDVAVILGPSLPAPLSVRIADWMTDSNPDMRFLASAGALLQLGVTLAAMVLWRIAEAVGGAVLRHVGKSGHRQADDRLVRAMACAGMVLSAAAIFAGLLVLFLWSIAGLWPFPAALPQSLTLKPWIRALPQIAEPMLTTLALAAGSAAIAVLLTISLLWQDRFHNRRLFQVVLYMPLLVPQICFLFGIQILGLQLGLNVSFPLLLFVHLIFVLPYVFLSLSPPWQAFDNRYEKIASALGAGHWRILLRIRLPMLTRAWLTAFAVGFAVSIGLYLPTLLIGAGRITSITTEAVALSSGGDRRTIGVYALLQALLPFFGFLIASLAPRLLFRDRRAMRI